MDKINILKESAECEVLCVTINYFVCVHSITKNEQIFCCECKPTKTISVVSEIKSCTCDFNLMVDMNNLICINCKKNIHIEFCNDQKKNCNCKSVIEKHKKKMLYYEVKENFPGLNRKIDFF